MELLDLYLLQCRKNDLTKLLESVQTQLKLVNEQLLAMKTKNQEVLSEYGAVKK